MVKEDPVRLELSLTPSYGKKPIIVGQSICPQYGTYFNFCPNCAYNNTKNDFKFCILIKNSSPVVPNNCACSAPCAAPALSSFTR